MAVDAGTVAMHRALADVSRVRILEELKAGPLDVPALAQRVGLHPNTVRSHLDILSEAGLVSSGREKRERPGRPRVVFQVVAGLEPPGEGGGYRLLAKILASHLAGASPDPTAAAEDAGAAWGRYLIERPPPFAMLTPGQATEKVVQLLAELGFAPESTEAEAEPRILLHRCPFREAVETNQDVVCSVHLGLIKGALQEMGAPLEAARLEPLVTPTLCVAHLAAAAGRSRRP